LSQGDKASSPFAFQDWTPSLFCAVMPNTAPDSDQCSRQPASASMVECGSRIDGTI
jgi:hypothetical protein